jgi:hypothetical protein
MVEPRTAPDLVPGVAGDHRLEVGVERRARRQRAIHPGVAQHLAAHRKAGVEEGAPRLGDAVVGPAEQEGLDGCGERGGRLQAGQMRGVEPGDRGARNGRGDAVAMSLEGRREVPIAGDDKSRRRDPTQPAGERHVADGGAAAGVAVRAHAEQARAGGRHHARLPAPEPLGEEALHRHVGDGRGSAGPHRVQARLPEARVHLCRRARKDQRLHALGSGEGQGHGDHAAQRHAADGGAPDTSGVQHRQGVLGQVVQAVIARGRVRGAVPPRVHPQKPEARREIRDHAVPQAHVHPDGVQEQQRRLVGLAIGAPVQPHAIPVRERHQRSFR